MEDSEHAPSCKRAKCSKGESSRNEHPCPKCNRRYRQQGGLQTGCVLPVEQWQCDCWLVHIDNPPRASDLPKQVRGPRVRCKRCKELLDCGPQDGQWTRNAYGGKDPKPGNKAHFKPNLPEEKKCREVSQEEYNRRKLSELHGVPRAALEVVEAVIAGEYHTLSCSSTHTLIRLRCGQVGKCRAIRRTR